jgi:SHS2 domain-containing protein
MRRWGREMTRGPAVGYRLLPHTADVVVQAWAPTRAACLAEAVRGLVAVFADTAGVVGSRSVAFTLGPAGDEELLVRLLEEVIYLVEVDGVVPVDVRVELTPDGGLRGRLDVAPLEAAIVIGPAPKAVAWHELSFAPERTGWRCRVTVDV